MNMKTIKNIPHDLLPMIQDIAEQLVLLRTVKSAIDHSKLLEATQNNTFLVEQYLLALDKEADQHGIQKA